MSEGKTHYADDDTLKYLSELEKERDRYKKALEEIGKTDEGSEDWDGFHKLRYVKRLAEQALSTRESSDKEALMERE